MSRRARREREPAGALDAAMRRGGRDQQVGRLDASYCRATDQFLHNSGLPDEDVEAVMQILSKYAEEESAAEDAENMNMREDPRIRVGGPCGQIGAQDRRLALDALDQFGKPRRRCDATAERTDQAGWGSRFRPPEERGLTTRRAGGAMTRMRQQREFDPDDIPPVAVAPEGAGMREARRRLADRVASRPKEQAPELPRDDFVRRLDAARAAVAPHEPVAYRFIPLSGAWVIKAITPDDLAIAIPGTTLKSSNG